jgi:16S rRNA (guanine966-N2)-methyltransferase
MNKPRKTNHRKHGNVGSVRIIGGEWGGRKISVPDLDGLRPTTDRVRETLFNWLMPYLPASNCLDVCAGSGSLGFEALSRGASKVDFVEKDVNAAKVISQNAKMLEAKVNIQNCAILDFLNNNHLNESYDIVFVDPPFDLNMHEDIFRALQNGGWLKSDTIIYCEKPRSIELVLPESWYWFKEKRSKNLEFGLLAF